VLSVAVCVASLGTLVGCTQNSGTDPAWDVTEVSAPPQPWEWWRDLARVASLPDNVRTVMHSSFCPSGCKKDHHTADDPRFLELRDGEGVIFTADGAGALTRIWMVMGDRISTGLDPAVRLRVRIDGDSEAVVDLPLPRLFDGSTPPFVRPLVADLTLSGGGNVSYVPIPFRRGCTVSLVGAETSRIWYQVTARLVDHPSDLQSFSPERAHPALQRILARAGRDPWSAGSFSTASGTLSLAPGDGHVIAELEGPDVINGLVIRTKRKGWERLGLLVTFDDREPLLIPLVDLFGRSNAGAGTVRSLFLGADEDDDLYCYFPMPFFDRAKVELLRRPVEGPSTIDVEYALRTAGTPPPDDAGYFGVQIRRYRGTDPDEDLALFEDTGRGRIVGVFADFGPSRKRKWVFLEADERVFIDGESDPSWHGTGVEDFFNGGFFFRDRDGEPAPFTTALAGAPFLRPYPPRAVLYRLLLGDAVDYHRGIRAELETSTTGRFRFMGSTAVVYYSRPVDRGDTEE
jgi:hypothetical protein